MTTRSAALVAAIVTVSCVLYNAWCFGFVPLEADAVSYMFQARLFAQGRVTAPPPPSLGFLPSANMNVGKEGAHSKYPPGNALAIALGVVAGAPWLIPALAAGGAVYLLYLILLETTDRKTAGVGVVLAALSPPTVVMGAVWFSESVSRFCIGLFLFGALRAFRTRQTGYAILSGLALGYAFDTRPLTAVAIGAAAMVVLAFHWRTSNTRREALRLAASLTLAGALAASLTFWWNFKTTGEWLTTSFSAEQKYDRLGFGTRGWGSAPEAGDLVQYQPVDAVRRTVFRTVPIVLQNTLGVGFYSPDAYDRLLHGTLATRAAAAGGLVLLLIPAGLIGAGALAWNSPVPRWIFLSIPTAVIAAYALYFFDGAYFGSTPTSGRYYTEATMFGLVPLAARGIVVTLDRWRNWRGPRRAFVATACAVLVGCYGYNQYRFYVSLSDRASGMRQADREIRTLPSRRAVAFFEQLSPTPLGDAPFTDLANARVITFRLFCAPAYGLRESDLSEVYRRYFQGREAFLFTPARQLRRLSEEELARGTPGCGEGQPTTQKRVWNGE